MNINIISKNKMNTFRGYIFSMAVLVIFALILPACSQKKANDENTKFVFYINMEGTKVVPKEYVPVASERDELIAEYLNELQTEPKEMDLKSPISSEIPLVGYDYSEGLLRLDFDETYLTMEKFTEIISRAAIVRTLMQVDGVEGILFTVNGISIIDSKLQPIGVMTADMFVDNTGSEINSYEKADLRLYFADEEGTGLISSVETVMYSTNIALDKLVVEHLIEGPDDTPGKYPVVGGNVKILGVTTKDGTCYLNFSQEFLTKEYNVTDEVIIYSFVNSLTELSNINKVQFMIDSETNITFGDHIYLSEPFERNLDIMSEKM